MRLIYLSLSHRQDAIEDPRLQRAVVDKSTCVMPREREREREREKKGEEILKRKDYV